MKLNYDGNLVEQSFSLILAAADQDEIYKNRLENFKLALEKINKHFLARQTAINNNGDRYEASKIQDLQYNLRVSTRSEIEELVRVQGFKDEISECQIELKKIEPLNDVQALTKTLLEIEVRKHMAEAGDKFDSIFLARIVDGDPLIISSIENSPIDLPLGEDILENAKEKMRSILKPLTYKKYAALVHAEETLADLVALVMPYNSKRDQILEQATATLQTV
ncbi:MAG: hypothetical protein J7K30_00770 [Deltaproteobacteria bacterium]|nr:hypothetical protein [Deltaproteobacteria bacterium]